VDRDGDHPKNSQSARVYKIVSGMKKIEAKILSLNGYLFEKGCRY